MSPPDDDQTPMSTRRSGEHQVSTDELLREIRSLRKENNGQNAAITAEIKGLRSDLNNGSLTFERHHARLNALESWRSDHRQDHEDLDEELSERAAAAQAEAKSPPHWITQAFVSAIVSAFGAATAIGIIYLLTVGSKATP
jgi:peptidoglycan hydrolase CwlO-like protein